MLSLDPDFYEGRNDQAYSLFENASGPKQRSKFEAQALQLIQGMTSEFAQSDEDVHTFLRNDQQEAESIIEDLRKSE